MFKKTKEKLLFQICNTKMKAYEADFLVKKGLAFRYGNDVFMNQEKLKKHNLITLYAIRKKAREING